MRLWLSRWTPTDMLTCVDTSLPYDSIVTLFETKISIAYPPHRPSWLLERLLERLLKGALSSCRSRQLCRGLV